MTEEIPPCTPVTGPMVDPCEPDAEQYVTTGGGLSTIPNFVAEPRNMRGMFNYTSDAISHIVLRGTFLADTVRCTADNPFRPPSFLSYDEYDYFLHALAILCYVDVRVGAYILGNGPSTLTVKFFWEYYGGEWFAIFAAEQGKTEQEYTEDRIKQFETANYVVGIVGREVALFLGPATDVSTEVWEIIHVWDVQRRDDSIVIAVHPERDLWRTLRPDDYQTHISKLEMELPEFTRAVTTAHQARVTEYGGRIDADEDLPMLLTDANQLRQYFTAVGTYNDTDHPPAQPPPPCGIAVSDQATNPGLMRDCITLLAAKDTLRGSAALNWSVNTAITDWDGMTTGGTPSRVTRLLVDSKSLSGSIPAELGGLYGLTHLNLSSNSLTGQIPWELGKLPNLTEIRLSGNSLTGCIPPALKDVTTNDLSSLNLLYCPPAPGGLTAGTTSESGVPLSWTAIANAAKYRVEYRDTYYRRWKVDDETITGTTHIVDSLQCESRIQFRVSAFGDGTTNSADWGEPSETLVARTGACTPPTFAESSYAFSIADDGEVGDSVGTVSATDTDGGETVSYSIIAGDDDGTFEIDSETGEITVAGSLNYVIASSYTLTVEASDESGGSATATVTVTVEMTKS